MNIKHLPTCEEESVECVYTVEHTRWRVFQCKSCGAGDVLPPIVYGIAYTANGANPSSVNKIVRWMKDPTGQIKTWEFRNLALEACEMDGWRGYVCGYPDGDRSESPTYPFEGK